MLLRNFKVLFFAGCLGASAVCNAQEALPTVAPWSGFGIEVTPFAGKVFKHEAKFRLPIPEISTGLDVNFVLHSYGKKAWEQNRHYPTIGVGITYTNYGIDSVYGRCVGIYPNLELPIVKSKWLDWVIRIGDGVGYVSKHFSRSNPVDTINGAIGSHLNDFAFFATDLHWHVNKHLDIGLGGQFTHISDASFRKPNLGVNFFGGHLSVSYFPVTSNPAHIVRKLKPLKNRWLVHANAGAAFVSIEAPGGPLHPVYLASGAVSRRWRGKNKMFAGLDYEYHSEVYAFIKANEIYPGGEKAQSWKSAFFVGNEYLFGRVGIILQVGVYLKEAALKQDPYYEKIGGHLYLVQREKGPVKEFYILAFLKTHKTVAELGEFGVGFGF